MMGNAELELLERALRTGRFHGTQRDIRSPEIEGVQSLAGRHLSLTRAAVTLA